MPNIEVTSYSIEPKYRRESGLYLQDIDRPDLPLGFEPVERSLVTIPPGQIGGNHAHSRQEGFIGIGSGLELHWIDTEGETHTEAMNSDDQLKLFVISSMVPHAVRNGGNSPAILLEYASQTPDDGEFEKIAVIGES